MINRFVIRILDSKTMDYKYLNFDSRDGSKPYWTENLNEARILTKTDNIIDAIKNSFHNKRGTYYNEDLKESSLTICVIGIMDYKYI